MIIHTRTVVKHGRILLTFADVFVFNNTNQYSMLTASIILVSLSVQICGHEFAQRGRLSIVWCCGILMRTCTCFSASNSNINRWPASLAQILPQQLMHYVHYAIENTQTPLCVPIRYSLIFKSNVSTLAFAAHAALSAADFQSRANAAAIVPIYGTRVALLLSRRYFTHYRMP